MSILSPQTWILVIKELWCTFLRRLKRWSRWLLRGRSPTLRHVSRTHRIALDWLFDRISLDNKIQIRYVDSRNQLADILTEGTFTRDEWNHLLSLFNSSFFSSHSCSEAMAKRKKGRWLCGQIETSKKFGVDKTYKELNSAINDVIFKPGELRI